MAEAGLDIPHLVEATRRVDADGVGISRAYIGFLVGTGKSAREECSDRAAELLALALDKPVDRLFAIGTPLSVVAESTSTPRVQIMTSDSPPALPPQLMTSKQLCAFLQKSASWLEKELKDCNFPVHWAGRSRRFIPTEVLAYQADKRKARLAKAS
jgi:hypothetical protein